MHWSLSHLPEWVQMTEKSIKIHDFCKSQTNEAECISSLQSLKSSVIAELCRKEPCTSFPWSTRAASTNGRCRCFLQPVCYYELFAPSATWTWKPRMYSSRLLCKSATCFCFWLHSSPKSSVPRPNALCRDCCDLREVYVFTLSSIEPERAEQHERFCWSFLLETTLVTSEN